MALFAEGAILLFAAIIEKVLNLPGEEAANIESADSDEDGAAQPGGEQSKFKKHLTASLCGPDEICTSVGQ